MRDRRRIEVTGATRSGSWSRGHLREEERFGCEGIMVCHDYARIGEAERAFK